MKSFSIPMRLIRSIFLIGLLCLSCRVALANEASDVPPPMFETRYIKEGDHLATTSKCIGNPITPICAVDTWKAARFYKDDKLLEIARGKLPGTIKLKTPPPYNPYLTCYQIVGYWVYQEEDRIYETQSFLKPGDVAFELREGVVKKEVDDETPIPGKCDLQPSGYPFYSLLLRKGPYGWYVFGNHHMIDFVRGPEQYQGIGK